MSVTFSGVELLAPHILSLPLNGSTLSFGYWVYICTSWK